MKPNPSLIPRFNFDNPTKDFIIGLEGVLNNNNYDISSLKSEFPSKELYFTNYSRSAIYLLLNSLKLPAGSKVGVPLYTCNVVLESIVKARLKPCFIDINRNYTLDLEDFKKKVHEIDALIVIHTFGRPADMDNILSIAEGLPVIEDCAHSTFSEYRGCRTGLMGNAGVLSLPKYLCAGGGGMIILNDESMKENIESQMQTLVKNSLIGELKHLFIVNGRSFFYRKPWFGLISLPLGSRLENSVDLMDKKNFTVKCINKSDFAVLLNKIQSFASKVEKQRRNSLFLLESLKDTHLTLPIESKDTYCNYYLFPVLVPHKEERDSFCKYLRERGVDTTKLFSETPEMARLHYEYENDCPFTEDICGRILTIPNHSTLNKQELNKIIEVIKSYNFKEF